MYAEIIINSNARALNKTFDYIVPKDLEETIKIGSRIFVPFGNQKKLEDGFVISLKESSEFANKEIARIDEKDSLTEANVTLAKLMARKYFCNISECIKLLLPPGRSSKDESSREKEKLGNFIYPLKSEDEILFDIEQGKLKSKSHIKVCNFLVDNKGIYSPDLEKIMEVSHSVIKTLEKNGYIEIRQEQIVRNPFINKEIERDTKKVLNEEQLYAYNRVAKNIEDYTHDKYLLYGITGSGKTEIYLQLIEKVLKNNRRAIVLVPEISLTPQMVDRFLARFGEVVAVLHSKLSNGERYDEWCRIKNGEAKIVIGARSAIFAPVEDLGIIIIDEEHDLSYKADSTPRYNAKDLATFISKTNNVPLVLGSATPEIGTFYKAEENEINLLKLTKRANNANLPEVKIIDLREELAQGNRSMFSNELKQSIKENLDNKKQTILFLNRRGYSTFIMCRDCGYVAKCKNCNISLTYHMRDNILKCHYCGYEQKVIKECPECSSPKVKYFGTGTQKVEEEIQKLFPEASTIRMDIDTVSKKNSHEDILNAFKNENIDILIGTQMVVKGHHFPNVTLVGVISADGALNQDDYRAVERTFQTLVQVAGRSGRESQGKVLIQTYNPDHYAIIDSQKQDYDMFYNQEIGLRKMLKYPPFCDIILARFQGKNLKEIEKLSNRFYNNLNSIENNNLSIYKPVPAPIDKINGSYRWRVIIKGKVTNNTIDMINYSLDEDCFRKAKDTTIVVDINPNSMM